MNTRSQPVWIISLLCITIKTVLLQLWWPVAENNCITVNARVDWNQPQQGTFLHTLQGLKVWFQKGLYNRISLGYFLECQHDDSHFHLILCSVPVCRGLMKRLELQNSHQLSHSLTHQLSCKTNPVSPLPHLPFPSLSLHAHHGTHLFNTILSLVSRSTNFLQAVFLCFCLIY